MLLAKSSIIQFHRITKVNEIFYLLLYLFRKLTVNITDGSHIVSKITVFNNVQCYYRPYVQADNCNEVFFLCMIDTIKLNCFLFI